MIFKMLAGKPAKTSNTKLFDAVLFHAASCARDGVPLDANPFDPDILISVEVPGSDRPTAAYDLWAVAWKDERKRNGAQKGVKPKL